MRAAIVFVVALLMIPGNAVAQEARAAAKPGPWFGVPLPPPLGKEPAVIVGDRSPRPVTLPPGEPAAPELVGAPIKADVETIVGFSKESQNSGEIGSGQMWGRIAGLPSGAKTVGWAASSIRRAIRNGPYSVRGLGSTVHW